LGAIKVRTLVSPGDLCEAFLVSFLVCAVQQLPKIFSLGEQQAFEVRFFRHGKKYRTRPAVFCDHDGFFRSQFLNDLAQLGLNFAQASIS
jgi:hypothetical protein